MKKTDENPIFEATLYALKRCQDILESTEEWPDLPKGTGHKHLKWMCKTIQEEGHDWPIDKTSRWLGFIQGILCSKQVLSVENERNETRHKFHEAYQKINKKIPKTLNNN